MQLTYRSIVEMSASCERAVGNEMSLVDTARAATVFAMYARPTERCHGHQRVCI